MSDPDVDALAHALREIAMVVIREAPRHELSRTAVSTLSVLERTGAQRITALAEQEVVTQPSMTTLIQRLEGQGYVSRATDPADGRASLVAITPAGARVVAARREGHERVIAARLRSLAPEELAALDVALPALIHLVETTITTNISMESHVSA